MLAFLEFLDLNLVPHYVAQLGKLESDPLQGLVTQQSAGFSNTIRCWEARVAHMSRPNRTVLVVPNFLLADKTQQKIRAR